MEIRNANELVEKLRQNPEGLRFDELRHTYKTVQEDLERLEREHEIFRVNNPDIKGDMYYPNDTKFDVPISQEFRDAWKKVPIPLQSELEAVMKKDNLGTMQQKQVQKQAKTKAPKQRQKRAVKMVNVHLQQEGWFDKPTTG
jgi:hypothetical protein